MTEHAPLAPSAATQWANCTGSVRAQAARPNVETSESRNGTAAHWVFSDAINAYRWGRTTECNCGAYVGLNAPNGVIIDGSMAEGAQVMVDTVLGVCREVEIHPQKLLVEHRVHMPQIHVDNWGTLDAALYAPTLRTLYIWDYKHGHRDCPADENYQLIDYVLGLVNHYEIDGHEEQKSVVVISIVQPFCYYARSKIKTWRVNLSSLRGYWNLLSTRAHQALADPELTTGIWCRDCRAIGCCSATREARFNFVELVGVPYAMDALPSGALAQERTFLRDGIAVAKARLDAVEDELRHRIQQGDSSSGLTIEAVPGREVWDVPVGQAKALFNQFNTDISKPGVLTPAQALKAVPTKIRPFVAPLLKQFTKRDTALTLVPVNESRNSRAFKKSGD